MSEPHTLIVSGEETLSGTHYGSVEVREGSTFTVTQRATLYGSISIAPGAKVRVHGSVFGGVTISREGLIEVERTGRVAGTIQNNGTFKNSGTRAGPIFGTGEVFDLDGGVVKPPRIGADGSQNYDF